MTEDQVREKLESMQIAISQEQARLQLLKDRAALGKPTLILEPKVATPEVELQELKRKYEKLKSIVVAALISLDVLLKFGMPVILYFWPLTQNNLLQSIGLAVYVILLTIISKTITKIKTPDHA